MTIMAGSRSIAVGTIEFMTAVAGGGITAEGSMRRTAMVPAHPGGNLAAGRSEMASVTTDTAATATIVTAMTGSAGVDVLQGSGTMVAGLTRVEPGLTGRMIHGHVAIVTTCGTVAIVAIGGMAGITGIHLPNEIAMGSAAVSPTRSIGDFAAGRSEVTAVATDAAAAALVVAAMAGRTGIDILLRGGTVIITLFRIEPGLSGGMSHIKMAIVTGVGTITIGTAGGMAGITGRHFAVHTAVRGGAMNPTRTGGDFASRRPKVTTVTAHAAAAAAIIAAVAGGTGIDILQRCSAMVAALL